MPKNSALHIAGTNTKWSSKAIADNPIGSGGLANTLVSLVVHTKNVTSMHAENVRNYEPMKANV